MKLLMFPLASGMIGSSGENLHYPSTMNLYLNVRKSTGGALVGVAAWMDYYDCDWKLITLLFEGDGLFPFVERPCKQYLVATVVPSEGGEDIWLFELLLFVDCATAIDLSG